MLTLEKAPLIEALESEVVEFHRSLATAPVTVEGPAPLAVQAFVCVLKREGEYLVQTALFCKEIKRALIYRSGSAVDSVPAYRELLGKALRLAEVVGCQMEAMNLKYSSAMRGVILRDIPVLAPPGSAKKALLERAAEKTEWEQLIAENEAAGAEEGDDSSLPPEKRMERRQLRDARTAKAETAARRLAAEKRFDDLEGAWGQKMAPLVDEINGVKPALPPSPPPVQKEDNRIGPLEEKCRQLEKELAAERNARGKAQQAKGEADKLIAELQQALKQAEKKAEAAGTEASKRDETEKLSTQLGELEQKLRQAKEEAAAEREEKEHLQQEKAADEKRLQKLTRDLQKAEERARAASPAPMSAEDDGRVAELEEALRQAEAKAEFLRQEMERMAAAKALAERRAEDLAAGPSTKGAPLATPETPAPAPAPKAETGPDPRTVRRPPPPGAFFRVDWDLTVIPCAGAQEICEIHRSTGMVKLSLEGYPNQYCAAFITVVKTGEVKKIYMPFRLATGNQLLIYIPVKQPDSAAALAKAMKEAVKFLQVVGMDVEQVAVGKGKLPPEISSLFSFAAGA